MKIKLSCSDEALRNALEKKFRDEGDDVLEKGHEEHIVLKNEVLPLSVLEALNFETMSPLDPTEGFILFRYWNGKRWHRQTLIGFPVVGMMNENLGTLLPTGMVTNYLNLRDFPKFWERFENNAFIDVLKGMSYKGFVTLVHELTPDGLDGVTSCILGIPRMALFSMLEGCPFRISEFLINPIDTMLLESWSAVVKVTRSPWPYAEPNDTVTVKGLGKRIRKHFWLSFLDSQKREYLSKKGLLGFASGWSQELQDAVRRALKSCRTLSCKNIQYRTDLTPRIMSRWTKVRQIASLSFQKEP